MLHRSNHDLFLQSLHPQFNYSHGQIWYAMTALPVCKIFSPISVTPLNSTITGCEIALTVDQPHNITCSIDLKVYDGRENIAFLWTLDDETLPGPHHTFVRHDENKTTLGSMLDYNFTPGDENKTLVCFVQYFYNPSATKIVRIHSEFLGQRNIAHVIEYSRISTNLASLSPIQ